MTGNIIQTRSFRKLVKPLDFGELRSRIHNGERISLEELKELSKRDNYEDEIAPYLAGFDSYWRNHPYSFHLCGTAGHFQRAPFFIYKYVSVKPAYFDPEICGDSVLNLCILQHRRSIETGRHPVLDSIPAIPSYRWGEFSQNSTFRNLKGLHIQRDIGIDDEGLSNLVASPHMSNLEDLCIASRLVTDEGAFALANSSHLNNLKHLDVSECALGSVGEQALLNSPYLQNTRIRFKGQWFSDD